MTDQTPLEQSAVEIRRLLAEADPGACLLLDCRTPEEHATARIAGVMAAKRTSDIVPLCHPLPLDAVEVAVSFPDDRTIAIDSLVRTTARTGVEMEALCAVAAAALAVYDMCKAVDPGIVIEWIRLEQKTGGIHGDYARGG